MHIQGYPHNYIPMITIVHTPMFNKDNILINAHLPYNTILCQFATQVPIGLFATMKNKYPLTSQQRIQKQGGYSWSTMVSKVEVTSLVPRSPRQLSIACSTKQVMKGWPGTWRDLEGPGSMASLFQTLSDTWSTASVEKLGGAWGTNNAKPIWAHMSLKS